MYGLDELQRMLDGAVPLTKEKTFGRLLVKSFIGYGSIGEVYELNDTDTGERLAFKLQRDDMNSTDINEVGRTFYTDIECSAGIGSHPNVIKTLACLELYDENNTGFPTIVMEYFESQSLQKYINKQHRKGLSLEEAVNIALQIAAGLSAIHKVGYIHRDLTALNVLLSKDGHVRISDLGLARKINYSSIRFSKYYEFIAPELTPNWPPYDEIQKVKGDERSDLYSVGALLFFMTTAECLTTESETRRVIGEAKDKSWDAYPLEEKLARIELKWQPYIDRKLQKITNEDLSHLICSLTHFNPYLRNPATAEDLHATLDGTLRRHNEQQLERKRVLSTTNMIRVDPLLQKLGITQDQANKTLLHLLYQFKQDPEEHNVLYKLGMLFADLAMNEHALTYFSLALQHSTGSNQRHKYFVARGIALSNFGRTREAVEMVNKTFQAGGASPSTYINCGNIYKRNEMVNDAHSCYSRALVLDNSDVSALSGLGWCYAKNGNRDAAQEHIELARYKASEQNSELGMWRALRGGAEVYELLSYKKEFNECFLGMLSVMPHRALWIRQGYIDSMRQKDMLLESTLSCISKLQAAARPIQQIVKSKSPYQLQSTNEENDVIRVELI